MTAMTVTDEHMNTPSTKSSGEEIRWLSTAAAAERPRTTNGALPLFTD